MQRGDCGLEEKPAPEQSGPPVPTAGEQQQRSACAEATRRRHKREDLLAATEEAFGRIQREVR